MSVGEPMTASRRPEGAHARQRHWGRVYDAIVLAVALVAALPTARLLEPPSFVEEVTVSNPTGYDIGITVRSGDGDVWMPLGTARRAGASSFERVIDQGDVWVFRFSAQGRPGGELRVERSRLQGDQWRTAIPEEVGRTLAEQGTPAPP